MRPGKTGTVFFMLHSAGFVGLCWWIYLGPGALETAGKAKLLFLPFGLFVDPLPALVLLVFGQIFRAIFASHLHETFVLSCFFLLGGFQWYLIGAAIRRFFSAEFWTGRKGRS